MLMKTFIMIVVNYFKISYNTIMKLLIQKIVKIAKILVYKFMIKCNMIGFYNSDSFVILLFINIL